MKTPILRAASAVGLFAGLTIGPATQAVAVRHPANIAAKMRGAGSRIQASCADRQFLFASNAHDPEATLLTTVQGHIWRLMQAGQPDLRGLMVVHGIDRDGASKASLLTTDGQIELTCDADVGILDIPKVGTRFMHPTPAHTLPEALRWLARQHPRYEHD